ncbi:chorismate--pyruvate lyase family protein [Aliiglaciecola litoralis]|uniref:Probable chorismate pyruvate-lyase n=1 Tax=Aliiglaciecola litoralis TaxID=582857 RepID=A0ABN1LHQ9_9ALTE
MTHSIKFPVTIPPLWQSPDDLAVADPYLRNWLLDTGSLTERLQSHCAQFDLKVIGQRPMQPELEEISQLTQPNDSQKENKWQIREVILSGNGQPWVFARSVLPQTLCDMDLAELGNRPLGQIIFNDQRFSRRPFQLLQIPAQHVFQQQLDIRQQQSLWGRRSMFDFNGMQLMVAEVFLPHCPAYRQQER